jgi:cytochrome c-type biogenesis protein CcmH/NrfG
MSRLLPALTFCCVIAIGGTAYSMLGDGAADRIAIPGKTSSVAAPVNEEAELLAARHSCSSEAIDAIVDKLRNEAAANPKDAHPQHLLAHALLDRVLQRNHLRGLAVGKPLYDTLPTEIAADLDASAAAITRARELGDTTAELFRLEAAMMGNRITGLGTALQWNGRIQEALAQAGELDPNDPHLQVALGLRKLLAPKLLGQDIDKALEHFEFAAKALQDDERPAMFAAMANFLQQKRQQAIAWLEQAAQRNPHNAFVRVVLGRCKRGEENPFGRDVTAAEANSAK